MSIDWQRKTEIALSCAHHLAPYARQEAEASGESPAPSPPGEERTIRLYASLKDLESYLRRIGALDKPIEDLGRPLW